MATPTCKTCGFSKTVISTPGAEEPGSAHPMVWDAVNQRWIDVKAEQQAAEQAANQPAAAAPPPAQPTGFDIPSMSIYVVVIGAIIAGVGGYYIAKKWK